MSDSNNHVDRWVPIRDLVTVLNHGRYSKSIADAISHHAKEMANKGTGPLTREFLRWGPLDKERKGERFQFKLSPSSLVFFHNLLDLESALQPKLAAAILTGKYRATPEILRKKLKSEIATMAVKHEVYGNWLADWPNLVARLVDGKFDPRRDAWTAQGPVGDQAGSAPAAQPLAARSLSLHIVKQLDAVDKRVGRDLDEPTAEVTKALLLIDLGANDLAASMLEDVLSVTPDHALANYAFAMLYLHQMQDHARQAHHFRMMRQEIDPDHASHWVHDEDDALEKVHTTKRTALARLARAFTAWPSIGNERYRHWADHQKRDHVLTVITHLAFDFAHEHAGGDLMNLLKLRDRREGTALESYFSPEVDAAVLAAAKEVEKSQPTRMTCSWFQRKTMLAQIYFALSPDEYSRFLPIWVEEFKSKQTEAIEPLLTPGWQGRAVMANVIREHLRRALAPDQIAALLGEVEARSIEATHVFHAEVLAFMNKIETDDVSEDWVDDSVGDW